MTNFIYAEIDGISITACFWQFSCRFTWKSNRNIRCSSKFVFQANIKLVLPLEFVRVF